MVPCKYLDCVQSFHFGCNRDIEWERARLHADLALLLVSSDQSDLDGALLSVKMGKEQVIIKGSFSFRAVSILGIYFQQTMLKCLIRVTPTQSMFLFCSPQLPNPKYVRFVSRDQFVFRSRDTICQGFVLFLPLFRRLTCHGRRCSLTETASDWEPGAHLCQLIVPHPAASHSPLLGLSFPNGVSLTELGACEGSIR